MSQPHMMIPIAVLDAVPGSKKPRAQIDKLRAELRKVTTTLGAHEIEVRKAQLEDERLYAQALGERMNPKLGNPTRERVEREHQDNLTRHGALEMAIGQAEDELLNLVLENAEEIIEPLVSTEQEAQQAFRDALQTLTVALETMRKATAACGYVRYVVEHDELPTSAKIGTRYHAVDGLAANYVEKIAVEAVLQGLGRLVDPVAEPEKAPVQPLANKYTGIVPDAPEEQPYEPSNARWLTQHRAPREHASTSATTSK